MQGIEPCSTPVSVWPCPGLLWHHHPSAGPAKRRWRCSPQPNPLQPTLVSWPLCAMKLSHTAAKGHTNNRGGKPGHLTVWYGRRALEPSLLLALLEGLLAIHNQGGWLLWRRGCCSSRGQLGQRPPVLQRRLMGACIQGGTLHAGAGHWAAWQGALRLGSGSRVGGRLVRAATPLGVLAGRADNLGGLGRGRAHLRRRLPPKTEPGRFPPCLMRIPVAIGVAGIVEFLPASTAYPGSPPARQTPRTCTPRPPGGRARAHARRSS